MGKLNGTNPNHPKKGSRITVDPIRSDKNIKKVKRLLKDNTRDLLLFTMGINNGLRISDLMKLPAAELRGILLIKIESWRCQGPETSELLRVAS